MNIVPFDFGGHQLRVQADEHGNPWFCAKDVCDILGYANDSDAIKKHCKAKGVANCYPLQTKGGTQYPTFISEGNLYRLIIKSNMPSAEPFEAWVCDEVLPSIRKTGVFADLDGRLTSLPQEQILANIMALADAVRAKLPPAVAAKVDAHANLVFDRTRQKTNREGVTKEETAYLRLMDSLGLPAITVVRDGKKIGIDFDWFLPPRDKSGMDAPEVLDAYKALERVCMGRKDCLKSPAFMSQSSFTNLPGFKSESEASALAAHMRKAVAESMARPAFEHTIWM